MSIRADLELADVVGAYERAGARALSVLTEETRFGGALEDLGAARAAATLPILRKDFIVEEYQVHEALAGGADAILLIVAALDAGTLVRLHVLAAQLGLATLVEVHDALELEAAARDRRRDRRHQQPRPDHAEVDIERTFELLPRCPRRRAGRGRVRLPRRTPSSSGCSRPGVDAVLIGEALMRAGDIEAGQRRDLLGSTS